MCNNVLTGSWMCTVLLLTWLISVKLHIPLHYMCWYHGLKRDAWSVPRTRCCLHTHDIGTASCSVSHVHTHTQSHTLPCDALWWVHLQEFGSHKASLAVCICSFPVLKLDSLASSDSWAFCGKLLPTVTFQGWSVLTGIISQPPMFLLRMWLRI